jgi:LPXTG-motif cell wall-anchored protein
MTIKNTPSKLASLMLMILGLPLLAAGLLAGASGASAAVIPDAITSISTNATTVNQWDRVDFTCGWAVPDGSKAGDTFTLQLPSQLAWWGSADFNLANAAGDTVATANADATGLVTFTLTNFVTTHPNDINGTCAFSTQYTAAQTSPGQETLEFPVGGSIIRVPIIDVGPCTVNCAATPPTEPEKYMWWTDNTQTVLQSLIVTPITTAVSTDISITDTPAAGLALDCTTPYAVVGKSIDAGGNISQPDDSALYPAVFTCSKEQLTATLTGLPAGEYVQVFVKAVPTDTSLSSYTNNGNVTMNGSGVPVAAQADAKSASGTGDGTSPTPTQTPSATPSVTPSESATPTPSATPSASESATPTPTQSPTPTPTTAESATPGATPSESAPATPSVTPSESVPATPSVTPSMKPAATPSSAAVTTSGQLAYTGAEGNPLLVGAGLLLMLGAGAVFFARKRSHQH